MLVAQAGEIVPKINVSFTPVKIEDIFPMENPNQYIFMAALFYSPVDFTDASDMH